MSDFVQNPLQSIEQLSQDLKKKQQNVKQLNWVNLFLLIAIPVSINLLNRFQVPLWKISLLVMGILAVMSLLHRSQQRLKREIETACYKLGVGVKLTKKFSAQTTQTHQYQIFQEGHRYYYLENTQTGEKRLVAKDKVLQDFDLCM